jgi:hypothetical protein
VRREGAHAARALFGGRVRVLAKERDRNPEREMVERIRAARVT